MKGQFYDVDAMATEIDRLQGRCLSLQASHDDLARALFRIRSLTMRGRGDTQVAAIACKAVQNIDETPLFEPEMSSGEASELMDQHLREG